MILQFIKLLFLIVLTLFFNNISFSETLKDEKTNSIFEIKPHDIVLGNIEAPVKFIEYSSPTCIHCARYKMNIFPLIKEKYIDTGKITYVIRFFIDNKRDKAAYILNLCVQEIEFLRLQNIIYKQQEYWAFTDNYLNVLYSIAKINSIDLKHYNRLLNDKDLEKRIFNDTSEILNYKDFIGTPSFFIGNKLYKNSYNINDISKNIENELKVHNFNKVS